MFLICASRTDGSSPLTRGALLNRVGILVTPRLIPAHAGSTPSRTWRSQSAPAHPRSRGEHVDLLVDEGLGVGSSPLTRGALRHGRVSGRAPGLIPAHAGSTCSNACHWCSCGAHPRSRGEHDGLVDVHSVPQGSSPLTRGARKTARKSRRQRRLIPAHAGSTLPQLGEEGSSVLSSDNSVSLADRTPLTRGCEPIAQERGLIPD